MFYVAIDYGIHGWLHGRKRGKKAPHPLIMVWFSVFSGIFCALVSLAFSPNHLIRNPQVRILNIVVSPLMLGLLAGIRTRYLRRKGKIAIRFEWFGYAVLFGVVFAVFRNRWAA